MDLRQGLPEPTWGCAAAMRRCAAPFSENRMRLDQKVAVVTGGGRGIGLAISQALAREGAQVVIASQDEQTGAQAARQVPGARFIQTDVTRRDQVDRLVRDTLQAFGRIDILVNNAATHDAAPFTAESAELWQRMFEVNVLGTVFPSQAIVPVMAKQGGGRIVNMASKAGVVGEPGHAAYSASKGAVIALTRAMAIELAPDHITVNAICPGPVLTDMLRGVIPDAQARESLGKEAPLGRLGRPADIAGAVVLFASDESDWCTGQALSIDGGFSVLK